MTILEIEYYKGDILLYGKSVSEYELRLQLDEIEECYDKNIDNFIELFCRTFNWTILKSDNIPNFVYDRDIGKIKARR